jgi:transcriptional regulator with XRE-family HTH domain
MYATHMEADAQKFASNGHTFAAAIVEQLRAERAARQMTVDQLAAAAGVSAISVKRYLSGAREIPIDVLARLAAALEVMRSS